MLQLFVQDIHLAAQARDKQQAIHLVANALVQAGCVADGYVNGMLARELQTSTYIGNGIAIPHGTTDTRDQVLKTGIQVFQFPAGIQWGDEMAYLVIGIAARSDEHLELLRQLTHVLSDDSLAEQVKSATSAETLCALLQGKAKVASLRFDESLLSLDVPARDLTSLQALNAGRLKAHGAVDASFISHVIVSEPVSLGQGIWLNDSPTGNLASAIAISRAVQSFEHQGEPMTMLITVALSDDTPRPWLDRLGQLLSGQQASRLLTADATTLIRLLSQDEMVPADDALSAEFMIRNPHGLHARPGAMLVNTVKQFTSEITVTNLNGTGKPVNARSLMKVVALGVKQGHTLRFSARGIDAETALQAIGEAISNGLGEGAA